MSTSTVLTVNYRDAVGGPWARILRILAIIAMIIAGAGVPVALISMQSFWPFQRDPYNTTAPRLYWSFFISSVVELIIECLLIAGAVKLMRRGSSRLILIGCWAMLIHLIAHLAIFVIVEPQRQYRSKLTSTIIHGGQMSVFPILILLLLAWRMGKKMEAQPVIAIDQPREDVDPWPRIIRIVAATTILFALIHLLAAVMRVHLNISLTSPDPHSRYSPAWNWNIIQATYIVMAILRGLLSAFIAAAAFGLFRRGRDHQLLIVSLRLWLVFWVLDFGIGCFAFGMGYVVTMLIQGPINAALPVAALLALREYAIDRPENPPLMSNDFEAAGTPG